MKQTDSLAYRPDPQLYLQLGELIASTGAQAFAQQMLRLVDAQVPIHKLDLSEWTLDLRQASVSRIKVLGSAGLEQDLPSMDYLHHPLLQSIMQMKDPLLIEFRAPPNARQQPHSAHQCNLVSRSGNRRWVICFHRLPSQRGFSLSELSQLKSLSDTLLPLVEHHGQLLEQGAGCALTELDAGSLRHAFGERLAQGSINLSVREQEVCMGLLTGGTVPQLAQRLNLKTSSIETYLKRATAKLGVSGRHGLSKWMAGA
ncbi:helix-turn-helix transcriptional regulator [Pseudomonas rubra]|uniref:Helix-turn-helix transcriptional regulator n=1 Tax=Pseudomonas rubra TaxID=2942627 RepID=A0ABT5P6H9_9PSED|nr:helix-turn-helix transcriptional regulator [Pseudomonas rubra]MDD1013904.1 helix-turn-helix transcriptional regulator [Pseudomonas rubra]MDD1038275.1 helix-turn-helix transcriptional regulator [Pseudomonas rubra]MDD1154635.1 helix-turn-helix transcriptional regulator [Pseudomonas rubra]